ncbi:unnamed protein product [Didymodactylos carnosus]|uniref:Uncharacterized protein n=1 Tax=Didymodactylos carnosus TaxID=1234261 RepID=A0A8S2FGD0_9BILA|nr:unnamed protein product [Didymodactylos carnosus]CAF4252652.1 unnamed protein product [Didymodactylos carnosus]
MSNINLLATDLEKYYGYCPLTSYGQYGIEHCHGVPSIPCNESVSVVLLHHHFMFKHDLTNSAANQLVQAMLRALPRQTTKLFLPKDKITLTYQLQNNYRHQCPLTYSGLALNLQGHQNLRHFPCESKENNLLLLPHLGKLNSKIKIFQHLTIHHNLLDSIAMKIIKLIDNIGETITFDLNDQLTNKQIHHKKYKDYCPFIYQNDENHRDGINIIRCKMLNPYKKVNLYSHLTTSHQLSALDARKVILALMNVTSPETAMVTPYHQVTMMKKHHFNDISNRNNSNHIESHVS